jgi:KaiC/GvpD/RAD55 family RecA-like ATPase
MLFKSATAMISNIPEVPMEESLPSLTQIAIFAEELNARCWYQVTASPSGAVQLQSPLLELRKRIALTIQGTRPFFGVSKLSKMLSAAGIEQNFDLGLVNQLCEIMLEPARTAVTANGDVVLTGIPHMPLVHLPARLYGRILTGENDFFQGKGTNHKVKLFDHWEEIVDPITAIEMFLVSSWKVRPHDAASFVQAWLRSTFALAYDTEFRYRLSEICEHLNEIFFDNAEPSRFEIAASRSAVATSEFICGKILSLLPEGEQLVRQRQALGIFMALRHARFINCSLVSAERRSERDSEVSTQAVHIKGIHCAQASRLIKYTNLLTSVFGSPFGVEGLGDILQGGLLVSQGRGQSLALKGRAGSGKTLLALSIAADIAKNGGLSLYVSLEESYAALVDRLVAFNLFSSRLFEVSIYDGSNVLDKPTYKGKLVFYAHKEGEDVALADIVRKLGKAEGWSSRVAIIDSVNAFTEGDLSRVSLVSLVDSIGNSNLLGVLVVEDSEHSSSINYLADSVIHMGNDETRQHRWLEVEKCRAQDYLPGQHIFRIMDMRGLKCYPNLAGVRNGLRQRKQQPFGHAYVIGISSGKKVCVPEKSLTAIWGGSETGKTSSLSLQLLMSDSQQYIPRRKLLKSIRPRHILVVSFSTPQNRFFPKMRENKLLQQWHKIYRVGFRWIPPGDEISLDEIIGDLQRYIREARRYGLPLERVLFHDVEASYHASPVSPEKFFWPTIFELLRTEGITAFLAANIYERHGDEFMRLIEAEADFIFQLTTTSDEFSSLIDFNVNKYPVGYIPYPL